jgi:hypothetical protein
MKDSEDISRKVARRVFQARGNHAEAHLSEAELAAILEIAIELYTVKLSKRAI